MTPAQLRQWSFRNSQPDQWWLCLDEVMEEIPVRSAEITEYLRSGQYSNVQVLHVSQADIHAPWTEVTIPPVLKATLMMDDVNVESNEQPKTSASGVKPVLPEQNKDGSQEVTAQHYLIAIGVIALVIFIFGKLMSSGESSGSERQEVNEPEISSANLWYEGGTLTNATMSEWNNASYANRLATSSDFVARMEQGQWDKYGSMDEMKPIATRLERAITASNINGASDNLPVVEVAAAAWLLINK